MNAVKGLIKYIRLSTKIFSAVILANLTNIQSINST
jgi:hypothetical protein